MKKWFLCFLLPLMPFVAGSGDPRQALADSRPAQEDPRRAQPVADEKPASDTKVFQVPYRLTDVKHILIRAKINGKGPFNFILDTGAPALFVSTAVCKKLDIEPDRNGWGTFDTLEIEGGLQIKKAKGRIEDPFQLEGMNSMGLAGAPLHGILGYNILARYKLEFDFTRDKMVWTDLNWEPKAPAFIAGKSGGGNIEALAALTKLMAAFIGKAPEPLVKHRGFIGLELTEDRKTITVKAVLKDSPASKADIQVNDQICQFQGMEVTKMADLRKLFADVTAGEKIQLKTSRNGKSQEITLVAGEGM
jgi:hypothetical protein